MTQYSRLLEATIGHLQSLSDRGVAYLPIEKGLLENLTKPNQKQVQSSILKTNLEDQIEVENQIENENQNQNQNENEVQNEMEIEMEWLRSQKALSFHEKSKRISHTKAQACACQKCPHLVRSRRHVVFGTGSLNAVLMFVGEAPGMDEDAQGEPFVGKAGELLTKIIEAMGLRRGEVYIGNVLKCRPNTPEQSRGNRKPTPQEMITCRPYLMEQIRAIHPKVIVALGATAVEGLMKLPKIPITKYRGTFRDFGGIALMPTYHPSYLLRNPSRHIKRQIWEDMLKVMKRLAIPISQKQRRYFSNPSK